MIRAVELRQRGMPRQACSVVSPAIGRKDSLAHLAALADGADDALHGWGYTSFVNRRRLRLWTLWLLPLLAARACVPVGFMLSVQLDGLVLTVCPGVAQSQFLGDATHHESGHDQHAHHGQTQQGQSGGVADDAPCPFALTGAAATSTIPPIDAVVAASDVPLPTDVSRYSRFGPVRSDRARGPPRFPSAVLV